MAVRHRSGAGGRRRIGNSDGPGGGLSLHTPLSIGAATFVTSGDLARLDPGSGAAGVGTLANALVIAVGLGVGVVFGPHPRTGGLQLFQG